MYSIVCTSKNSNLPVGQIVQHVTVTGAPSNLLPCNGQAVSQSMYPELYAVIGTQFGASTGMFKLPNLKGHVIPSLVYQDFWETWPCIRCKKTFSDSHDRTTWWCRSVDGTTYTTYYPMTNLEYLELKVARS